MCLRRSVGIVCATIAFVLVLGFQAVAQPKRIALVIGNAEYEYVSNLSNPANDASDIASALQSIGFDVRHGIDLEYNQMRLMIRDFAKAAANADVVIVYFAGHGIEIDDTNYLIPVNALLQSDRDVEFETIPLNTVIKSLSGIDGLKVILVDACRNKPFLSEMVLTSATRSVGRGLGRIDPGAVLVGYAARSGTLALDGDGRNSPYAQALLQHISEPGLEIGKMFRKVRDTVGKITDGYQQPFTYGSLPADDIFLVPAAAPSAMSGEKIGPDSPEQRLFGAAQSLGTISAWNTFLQRHSDSDLVDEARAARRALVAAISPEGEAPRTELTVPAATCPQRPSPAHCRARTCEPSSKG